MYDEQRRQVTEELISSAEKIIARHKEQERHLEEKLVRIIEEGAAIGMTLGELGETMGVTRERVRQLLAERGLNIVLLRHIGKEKRRSELAEKIRANMPGVSIRGAVIDFVRDNQPVTKSAALAKLRMFGYLNSTLHTTFYSLKSEGKLACKDGLWSIPSDVTPVPGGSGQVKED